MGSLADSMEDYLKKLLSLSASGCIDIKRKELAGKFMCVPSQVNYVLETRFTLEKGFSVESKRGGKGFVRIRKLDLSAENLLSMILQDIMDAQMSESSARGMIHRLYELKYISFRESRLMETTLNSLQIVQDVTLRNSLTGLLLRDMLLMLIKYNF
ncbi:MAG: CtsR family transcriptional regulator [Bacillota bacterium]|nr:CtsR family transcriptional regulator [Bacillota bacterium]